MNAVNMANINFAIMYYCWSVNHAQNKQANQLTVVISMFVDPVKNTQLLIHRDQTCTAKHRRKFSELQHIFCNNSLCKFSIFIPAKAFARDYVITGVGLSVCLFVTTTTK